MTEVEIDMTIRANVKTVEELKRKLLGYETVIESEVNKPAEMEALEAYERFFARLKRVGMIKKRLVILRNVGIISENELMDYVVAIFYRRLGFMYKTPLYMGDLQLLSEEYDLSKPALIKGLRLLKEHQFIIEGPTNWFRLNM